MKEYFSLIVCGLCLLSSCGGGSCSPPPPPPPILRVTPGGLTFGVSVVGTKSGPQVETLTNTGGSDLDINGVTITGANATDFDQSSTCGSSLNAGASCTLNVTFTPSQLGQSSASITISDNEVGSPQVLPLNGMGGDSGPNASLSQPGLNFGSQEVGISSAAQPVTLSNYGTMTVSITGITASTDFAQANTCNSTLASGASCTISLTFTPGQMGNLTGTLSVTDNAPGSPQTVSLDGTGDRGGGRCVGLGQQCGPFPCCPGLVCVFRGGSTRVGYACEPPGSGNISRANSYWDRLKTNKLE